MYTEMKVWKRMEKGKEKKFCIKINGDGQVIWPVLWTIGGERKF